MTQGPAGKRTLLSIDRLLRGVRHLAPEYHASEVLHRVIAVQHQEHVAGRLLVTWYAQFDHPIRRRHKSPMARKVDAAAAHMERYERFPFGAGAAQAEQLLPVLIALHARDHGDPRVHALWKNELRRDTLGERLAGLLGSQGFREIRLPMDAATMLPKQTVPPGVHRGSCSLRRRSVGGDAAPRRRGVLLGPCRRHIVPSAFGVAAGLRFARGFEHWGPAALAASYLRRDVSSWRRAARAPACWARCHCRQIVVAARCLEHVCGGKGQESWWPCVHATCACPRGRVLLLHCVETQLGTAAIMRK